MLGLLHFDDVTVNVSYVLEQWSILSLHSPGSCRGSILGYILRELVMPEFHHVHKEKTYSFVPCLFSVFVKLSYRRRKSLYSCLLHFVIVVVPPLSVRRG
jgi:hypothetical protein